jgi:hypothetical protein
MASFGWCCLGPSDGLAASRSVRRMSLSGWTGPKQRSLREYAARSALRSPCERQQHSQHRSVARHSARHVKDATPYCHSTRRDRRQQCRGSSSRRSRVELTVSSALRSFRPTDYLRPPMVAFEGAPDLALLVRATNSGRTAWLGGRERIDPAMARHSCVNSSTTVKHVICWPVAVVSKTKS